jgi:hypothetical protein
LTTYALVEKLISFFTGIKYFVKEKIMPDITPTPTAQTEPAAENNTTTTIGFIFKSTSRTVIKKFLYGILIKTIVAGLLIKLFELTETFTKAFVEGFVSTFAGPIGEMVGMGCLYVFLTLPRKLLEGTITILDIVFDFILPD